MEAINIKQTKFGSQERRYGDHIYEWEITSEESAENVLEYCKRELFPHPELSKKEYREAISKADFEEEMNIVAGGYYEFHEMGNGKFIYRVIQEYID